MLEKPEIINMDDPGLYSILPLDIIPGQDYIHENCILHFLVFKCNDDDVQIQIDDMFEGICPDNPIMVATTTVLMTALYVKDSSSTDERYQKFGFSSESDVAFWILVMQKNDDNKYDYYWVPFFMFVDSGLAFVSGREVYGFPKQISEIIKKDSDDNTSLPVTIKTQFFRTSSKNPSNIDNRVTYDTLVDLEFFPEIEPDANLSPRMFYQNFQNAIFDDAASPSGAQILPPYVALPKSAVLGDALTGDVENQGDALGGIDDIIRTPMLMIKQFRRAEGGPDACYRQALVVDPEMFGDFDFLQAQPGTYLLKIEASESHPIANSLGLLSTECSHRNAGVVSLNFKVGEARIL